MSLNSVRQQMYPSGEWTPLGLLVTILDETAGQVEEQDRKDREGFSTSTRFRSA